MAEPVYPNDETRFPAQPEPVTPPAAVEAYLRPNLVPRRELPEHSRLNSAAETIGTAVGSAVEKVRQVPDRLQEMKKRFTVIRGRTQQDATAKAKEVTESVTETARARVYEARTRAQHYAHAYPLQTIGAMAGLGVVLGIALRLWRDHAD
jgi:ElaB/YqjD/DUF883 family membrane-anchored ribosome-binding protein